MTKRLPDELRADITDLESAKRWIEALQKHDLEFHFDDDPSDIEDIRTHTRTFHDADVPLIQDRVHKLFAQQWGLYECPHGYALALQPDRCKECGGDLIDNEHTEGCPAA